jgi:ketosteroid isomerase-like protein
MNLTRIIALTSLATALTSSPLPAATQQSAVMATVNQFIDGFNRGDTKAELATCAAKASIIDDFPPHEWQGPTACADWAAAYAADAKKGGATEGTVTLGEPWYLAVTGDRAYVVLPATFRWKDHGKPVTERNAVFTVALRKSSMGWRITGWAWSKH